MLLEKNSYPNDFPITIRVGKIMNYPIHYHQDIEFVLVLQGEIKLKNGAFNYLLHQGDVFINNGHEVHGIQQSKGDNVVAIVQVSNLFFTQYFPDLTKSCYKTYNEYENDIRRENIRKILFTILLDYYKKSLDYKQKCINLMVELIKYLNACFNLFAYENRMIVNVDTDNAVQIERMTRIINYIYERHTQKITLHDLAELEHLNAFYVSHIIKKNTGMSFQELLCFARAEWSEIYLLDSNKTISRIAREVGFSGTQFYEKHFIKWFGHTPLEHRNIYQSYVKSPIQAENIIFMNATSAINIIQQNLSLLNSQDKSNRNVQNIKLDLIVDTAADPLYSIYPSFNVSITLEDFRHLGNRLFDCLSNFNCRKVIVLTNFGEDDIQSNQLEQALKTNGYRVEKKPTGSLKGVESYGSDSIAGLIHLLKENLMKKSGEIPVDLMDDGDADVVLKGMTSLLTTCAVPKPSYFGAIGLSMLHGSLLDWGKYHSVIKLETPSSGYAVVAFNYNDEIQRLCTRNATIHETKDLLSRFNDELDLNFSLRNLSGDFVVTRYSMDVRNNIFDYMSKLNFSNPLSRDGIKSAQLYAVPSVEIYTEHVAGELSLNISLKGVGAQFVVISKVGEVGRVE